MSNLIEYSGIDEYIPKDILCYKEFNVESLISINQDKVQIKELVKVSVSPKITGHRVVKTPVGKSLEGQTLTGKKYVIQGENKIRIDYLAENGSNKIYYMNYKEGFSTSIIVHKNLIGSNILIPSIFIENINVELLNKEQILIITTVFATVER